jgi:hypothetical protein
MDDVARSIQIRQSRQPTYPSSDLVQKVYALSLR